MMIAFGDDVQRVLGIWRKGAQKAQSVNIDQVNKLTSEGRAVDEAIRETWTYKRAAEFGFTKANLVQSEGQIGAFTSLDVLIER